MAGRMELVTRATLAASAADDWERQYAGDTPAHFADVLEKLRALGPSPTPEAVDGVIGNVSWTRLECEVCQKPQDRTVRLEDSHKEDKVNICPACLRAALAMVEGGT